MPQLAKPNRGKESLQGALRGSAFRASAAGAVASQSSEPTQRCCGAGDFTRAADPGAAVAEQIKRHAERMARASELSK
jgi:hypothetical protein